MYYTTQLSSVPMVSEKSPRNEVGKNINRLFKPVTEYKEGVGKIIDLSNYHYNQPIPRRIRNAGSGWLSPQMHSQSSQMLKKSSKEKLQIDKGNVKSTLRMCYDISMNTSKCPKQRLAQVQKSVEELETRFSTDTTSLKELMDNMEKEKCENTINKIRARGIDYITEELHNKKLLSLQPKPNNRQYDFMEALEYNLRNLRKTDDISYFEKRVEAPKKTETIINARGQIVNLNEMNKNFSTNINGYIGEINNLKSEIVTSIETDDSRNELLHKFYTAIQNADLDTTIRMIREDPSLVNHRFSVIHLIHI